MADTVKVRIGLQSVRELELEVEDGTAIADELESAVSNGSSLVWVIDAKGNRHGIAVSKLAFVEVESDEYRPGVGFAVASD